MKAEQKKVYCNKCRHLVEETDDCGHPKNLYQYDTWLIKKMGYMHRPDNMNCRNNCKLYEYTYAPVSVEE